MGLASTAFLFCVIAVSIACLLRSGFRAIGAAMIISLIFYIQPVRQILEPADSVLYLFCVDASVGIAIAMFSPITSTSRLILITIAALIIIGHLPVYLFNLDIHTLDVIANYVGWLQILIMAGGVYADRKPSGTSFFIHTANHVGGGIVHLFEKRLQITKRYPKVFCAAHEKDMQKET